MKMKITKKDIQDTIIYIILLWSMDCLHQMVSGQEVSLFINLRNATIGVIVISVLIKYFKGKK